MWTLFQLVAPAVIIMNIIHPLWLGVYKKLTQERRIGSGDSRTHRKGIGPMRVRKNCAAWLGLAGACVLVMGCGGGDIPDPGSDANAAGGNPGGGGGPAAGCSACPAGCGQ